MTLVFQRYSEFINSKATYNFNEDKWRQFHVTTVRLTCPARGRGYVQILAIHVAVCKHTTGSGHSI